MAAIYSNGGNRWNILGFNLKEMRYLVYIRSMVFVDRNFERKIVYNFQT